MSLAPKLAYIGHGTRMYGIRPILGRPRGFWELQWVAKGSARPDNLPLDQTTGHGPRLYVSDPDSPHGWTDSRSGLSEVFVLHFRTVPPELALAVNPAKTLMVPLGDSECRQQRARFEEIRSMSGSSDARLPLKLEQILIEATLLVLGRDTPLATEPAIDRVEHALHWFAENIGENPSAEAVARAAGVSSAHLRRLFANAGKGSPKSEFTRLRMTLVQRCLRDGWKLERIAAYLGYSEASALSRAFALSFGCSPREWRQRERNARSER